MNFTPQQWLAMAVGVCAIFAGSGSAAQLTQIFGGQLAGQIAAVCGIIGAILSVPLTMMSGQASLVKTVAALPGVEKIQTNAQANSSLKSQADSDDPSLKKVV